jgi:hypothetical protein
MSLDKASVLWHNAVSHSRKANELPSKALQGTIMAHSKVFTSALNLAKAESNFAGQTASAWHAVEAALKEVANGDIKAATFEQVQPIRADFVSGYGSTEAAASKAWQRVCQHGGFTAPKSTSAKAVAKAGERTKAAEAKEALVKQLSGMSQAEKLQLANDAILVVSDLAKSKAIFSIIEADNKAAIKKIQAEKKSVNSALLKSLKAKLDTLSVEQLLNLERYIDSGCCDKTTKKVAKSPKPKSVTGAMAQQLSKAIAAKPKLLSIDQII